MPKKILFCASTVSHIIHFHLPYLKAFHDAGYEVWVAADREGEVLYADRCVALPLQKNILSLQNVKAVFAARRLLKEQAFDAVSTHTTLAGAVVRAAVLMLKKKPEVFHTCHGYLFHEEDGWKKWIYLLPEKICARVTETLMVMNREDEAIARRHALCRGELYRIAGMGIRLEKYRPLPAAERLRRRREMRLEETGFYLVYAAEFSKRKNQELLIRAFAAAAPHCPEMTLLLAGDGALLEECRTLAQNLGIAERIRFLGYVGGMQELYPLCDVSVTTSHLEGLPFNVMEAMACGLPVLASRVKGHVDLIEEGRTGLFFPDGDGRALADALIRIYGERARLSQWGETARGSVQKYGIQPVLPSVMRIYGERLAGLDTALENSAGECYNKPE